MASVGGDMAAGAAFAHPVQCVNLGPVRRVNFLHRKCINDSCNEPFQAALQHIHIIDYSPVALAARK